MPYAVQSRRPGSSTWTDYPNPTSGSRSMSISWADLKSEESRVFGQPKAWRVVRIGLFTRKVIWERPLLQEQGEARVIPLYVAVAAGLGVLGGFIALCARETHIRQLGFVLCGFGAVVGLLGSTGALHFP